MLDKSRTYVNNKVLEATREIALFTKKDFEENAS